MSEQLFIYGWVAIGLAVLIFTMSVLFLEGYQKEESFYSLFMVFGIVALWPFALLAILASRDSPVFDSNSRLWKYRPFGGEK